MVQTKRLIQLFAFIWFLVGVFLFIKGFTLLSAEIDTVSFLIPLALLVGLLKGWFILAKAGRRAAHRLASLPNPAPFKALYSRRDVILIVCMIGLGILMRTFHVPGLIRGPILMAVATALFIGAMAVLRVPIYGKANPS